LSGHDGVARYEIADPGLDHHHHMIDDETGKLVAFSDEALESAIEDVARRLGFRLTGHDVLLRGIQGAGDKS
jgi:Fur family ferric uptake transcriptional regulator